MTSASYTFTPDLSLVARLIDQERVECGYKLSLNRVFRNYTFAQGLVKGEALRAELPQLRTLDIDFYYEPGNEHIKGHGAIDLDFVTGTARLKCHGDWEWFRAIFDRWFTNLGLQPTGDPIKEGFLVRLKTALDPELFGYVEGSVMAGKYTAALSATVVFIEDRLRGKLGAAAAGMTGSDLAVYAFKNPGVLRPPLSGATSSEDGAFLIVKGWFALVRNLHGHHSSLDMTYPEVFAQFNVCNYVMWLVDNSVEREPKPDRAG